MVAGLRLQDIGEILLMAGIVYFGVWVLLHRKNIPRIPSLSFIIISTIDFAAAAFLIVIGFWNTFPIYMRVVVTFIYAGLLMLFVGTLWITIQHHRGKKIN